MNAYSDHGLAANLGLLCAGLDWPDRFDAAAGAGARSVEFPWPPLPAHEVTDRVAAAGVTVALLNMPAGDLATGYRGYSNDPGQRSRWRADLARALRLAVSVSCPVVNVLAGTDVPGVARAEQIDCLLENLSWAAPQANRLGIRLVVEPINTVDVPSYLLPRAEDVLAVVRQVSHRSIGLQLDTYHAAVMGEDPAVVAQSSGGLLGHVQLADYPGRHEPGTGTVEFGRLAQTLRDIEYRAAVAAEYLPTRPLAESLAQARRAFAA